VAQTTQGRKHGAVPLIVGAGNGRANDPRIRLLGVKTYKGAIYDALAEMIAELEMPPGSRLVEAELVTRFNVSKTPIREAFLQLEANGLIQLEPYIGARVTWMSVDDWVELLFIFDALEQPALALVAERITEAEIRSVKRVIAKLRRLRAAHDSRGYAAALWEMHRRLFAPTHYPRLLRMIVSEGRSVGRRYQVVFVHTFEDTWDLELETIAARVDALARRDPVAAANAVAEGHAELIRLARAHATDPRITGYLRP
jgi:DNA-binding GntR family transcriptional regulator